MLLFCRASVVEQTSPQLQYYEGLTAQLGCKKIIIIWYVSPVIPQILFLTGSFKLI